MMRAFSPAVTNSEPGTPGRLCPNVPLALRLKVRLMTDTRSVPDSTSSAPTTWSRPNTDCSTFSNRRL